MHCQKGEGQRVPVQGCRADRRSHQMLGHRLESYPQGHRGFFGEWTAF